MSQKKKKTFSTVQEILETYFPALAKRETDSPPQDYAEIGRQLASELAEKFRASLRR